MSEYTPIDSNIAFSVNSSDKGRHVCIGQGIDYVGLRACAGSTIAEDKAIVNTDVPLAFWR